jgi:hypothetical protein
VDEEIGSQRGEPCCRRKANPNTAATTGDESNPSIERLMAQLIFCWDACRKTGGAGPIGAKLRFYVAEI